MSFYLGPSLVFLIKHVSDDKWLGFYMFKKILIFPILRVSFAGHVVIILCPPSALKMSSLCLLATLVSKETVHFIWGFLIWKMGIFFACHFKYIYIYLFLLLFFVCVVLRINAVSHTHSPPGLYQPAPSSAPQDSLLCLCQFHCDWEQEHGFLGFCLAFIGHLRCANWWLSSHLRSFQPLFLQIFLLPLSLFSSWMSFTQVCVCFMWICLSWL
jgi:hypothetical protein